MHNVDPGVDVARLAFVATGFGQGNASPEERAARLEELMDRTATHPGVTAVAFTTQLPVQPGGSTTTVVEDYTPPAGTESVELPFALMSDDDFRTVGLRVTAGRAFGRQDALGTIPVVLVNETAARRFWDNTNPVGRRVRPQGNPDGWVQVVGVVEDSKVSSLDERPSPMCATPYDRAPRLDTSWCVQTATPAPCYPAPVRLGMDPTIDRRSQGPQARETGL